MKLYLFYRNFDNLEPCLYAYTTKKEYVNDFKDVRNMNAFILTKKEVSEEELLSFEKKHGRFKLKYRNYDSYDRELFCKSSIKILSTDIEEEEVYACFDSYLSIELGKSYSVPGECFNDEVKEALKILKYDEIADFYMKKFKFKKSMYYNFYGIAPDYEKAVDNYNDYLRSKHVNLFSNDYFGLFVKLFKWSL